jgi:hypothetical protein
MKQFKQILLTVITLCCVGYALAQVKRLHEYPDNKKFYQLLKQTNLKFTYPAGFRQITPVDDEDFSYDFAMELPGKDFEVWLQVKPQRQNWISYEKARRDNTQKAVANPDSMYVDISRADAIALSADNNILERSMPPEVLARYNADAGKSYLLNLNDLGATKHYKYALIVALQKNHSGTLIAVYFTNEKDADFYREVYHAAHCLRFTNQPGR